MANRRLSLRILQQLLPMLLISSLALSACSGSDAVSDYKSLTVKNYIAGFSCEYRAYYNDLGGPHIVDDAAHKYTYVRILAPKTYMPMFNPEPGGNGGTVRVEHIPAFIDIIAADAGKYPDSPAATRIEETLSDSSKWPNFKLLERSMVTVAGVEAELVAYQVDGFFVPPPLLYEAQVSFDHNGIQWDIVAKADMDMSETVRADIDHIIKTFLILE